MLIGIPREPEALVSATPDTVGKLIKLGYEVAVQSGAGDQSNYLSLIHISEPTRPAA